jgi:hypothetical protein
VSTRAKLGIIAIVLLTAGAYVHWFPPESLENPDALKAACLRVGFVVAALWLAYPELIKLPTWISAATMIATPIIAWKPRVALLVIPVLLLLWILYPKRKQGDDKQA